MSETHRLLELLEEAILQHGGALGGWTRLADETLQLFAGRVTLWVELNDSRLTDNNTVIHAHIFTKLHEHDDEVLDACLFGMGENTDECLRQAAGLWLTSVAGPIRSFLDNKPVCMTSQVGIVGGDISQGYSPFDYGLAGMRAFVGPTIFRAFEPGFDINPSDFIEAQPWFRFAAESAAPRRVHLAKVSSVAEGEKGWKRVMEIDGHDVSYTDPNWLPGTKAPEYGYATRYAVFEFPRNSHEIARRADLEKAIHFFAENYKHYRSIDRLLSLMVELGHNPDIVHEVESISTIAFGRALFEPHGVQYASTVFRARRDGRIEVDVPLMSIPAFTRARALAAKLRKSMSSKEFEALGLYNAESNAILQVMEASGKKPDLAGTTIYPCVVPDRDVDQETIDAALAMLDAVVNASPPPSKKKPWWKVW
jgi:hypothetical protein